MGLWWIRQEHNNANNRAGRGVMWISPRQEKPQVAPTATT
jgi:hypothetical protein